MMWQYLIHCFQVKRSSHAGRLKFLQCPLHGSMPIWPIRVICGTNSTNEGTMCHVPLTFPGQKVKVIQVIHIRTAEVWEWISNSIPMTNDERIYIPEVSCTWFLTSLEGPAQVLYRPLQYGKYWKKPCRPCVMSMHQGLYDGVLQFIWP